MRVKLFSVSWLFKMAHFAGRSSQKPNLQRCEQLSIVGVQHGRLHDVAGGVFSAALTCFFVSGVKSFPCAL
jgi:hypothetical protein